MMKDIGKIGNFYGGLAVKEENGKFFWSIENYNGHEWEEISETLYSALLVHEQEDESKPRDQRERFEKWVVDYAEKTDYQFLQLVLKRCGDGYATTWVDMAWTGWKASTGGE